MDKSSVQPSVSNPQQWNCNISISVSLNNVGEGHYSPYGNDTHVQFDTSVPISALGAINATAIIAGLYSQALEKLRVKLIDDATAAKQAQGIQQV
jgi:hypothetical protein